MHLVVYEVMQLEVVDVSAKYRIHERNACPSIIQSRLGVDWKPCFLHLLFDLLHGRILDTTPLFPCLPAILSP